MSHRANDMKNGPPTAEDYLGVLGAASKEEAEREGSRKLLAAVEIRA